MTTRRDIINEAYAWLGTPFRHQGMSKGVGCDCVGLPRGIVVAFGYDVAVEAYNSRPTEIQLLTALRANPILIEVGVPGMQPGDLAVFAIIGQATHVGILTDRGTVIHSVREKGVVENSLTHAWIRRIRTVFALRGVE